MHNLGSNYFPIKAPIIPMQMSVMKPKRGVH